MNEVVTDIDRPDVDKVPPRMQAICELTRRRLFQLAPVLSITTNDNFCSSVVISGSHTLREECPNGIFENGYHFTILIWPEKKKRYYEEDDAKVTVELSNANYKLTDKIGRMRKYTGPVDKVLGRIAQWLQSYQT